MKKYILMFGLTLVMGLFVANNATAQWLRSAPNTYLEVGTDNVGIGYTTPMKKLDVNGDLSLGNTAAIFARRSGGELHELFSMDGNNDFVLNRSALAATDNYQSHAIIALGNSRRLDVRSSNNITIFRVHSGRDNVTIGNYLAHPSVKLGIDGTVAINQNTAMPAGVYLAVTGKSRFSGDLEVYDANLTVEGKITSKEVEVKLDVWPDFVFSNDYYLRPLNEVEQFINTNRHLPDVPSEAEVLENGVNVGNMSATLLLKIEELTLYIIDLNKRIAELEGR